MKYNRSSNFLSRIKNLVTSFPKALSSFPRLALTTVFLIIAVTGGALVFLSVDYQEEPANSRKSNSDPEAEHTVKQDENEDTSNAGSSIHKGDSAMSVSRKGGTAGRTDDYQKGQSVKNQLTVTLWQKKPYVLGRNSVAMSAKQTPADSQGIEYYFQELTGNEGGDNSGWQPQHSYEDTDLAPGTLYVYRVKKRISGGRGAETPFSSPARVTTLVSHEKLQEDVQPMIESFYQMAFGSSPDAKRNQYWSERLTMLLEAGVSPALAFKTLGKNLFTSDKYKALEISDKEFITQLYGTFMERLPSASSTEFWLAQLENGKSRRRVLTEFLSSKLYRGKMQNYFTVDHSAAGDIVVSFFQSFMDKAPDHDTFNLWRHKLNKAGNSGRLADVRETSIELAKRLATSDSYKSASQGNHQRYITDVFDAVTQRAPGEGEFQYWLNKLKTEKITRTEMLEHLIERSKPFQQTVEKMRND